MKLLTQQVFVLVCIVSLYSCSVIEKSSMHGLNSGYYKLDAGNGKNENVYLDITPETIEVHPRTEKQVSQEIRISIPLSVCDSLSAVPLKFSKQSLDIDITTILLKYHPAVHGLPAQLTTDFNVALYAGWRKDFYRVHNKKDLLGKRRCDISSRGYDFGLFAGPGTTYIDANTTLEPIDKEYNGFVIQFGVAGFLETSFASFGISTGFDYLLSPDRSSWIFNKKPWMGFIIGIALN